ncbi:MAG TPA: protein kinase [Thermoanaerobaculia bacterium]|nr:protein kinase [Thermoanaerobaculia bacterium]
MRKLGKFEIIERLGAGGMGVVYRARDTELGRQVALKVLPEEVQTIPNRRLRFLHEARAVAALNHPAIATLYEFGEARDEHGERKLFLAMELVEGEDLNSMLASGPLPVRRAVAIARDLAAGLAAAHNRGIIHRDLKPGNVRVTSEGKVKILDFGLAKLAAPSGPEVAPEAPVTRDGAPLGTPPYLAPEQARGETVDARADLFSLGVLLFEMLTGKRPFDARQFAEYVVALERGPARSLRDEMPDASPHLVAVSERLLQRKRTARFASAAEVEAALRMVLARDEGFTSADTSVATETFAGSPRQSAGRALMMMTATALLLALPVLIVIAIRQWGAGTERGSETHRLAVLPFENLTGDGGLEYLARGLSATLSSELSSLPEISVISPSFAAAYSELVDGHQRLAREQGVDAIIEGRIQRERSTLRVAVDSIDADDGSLQWSLAFEGDRDAPLQLQSSVASEVGKRLRSILSPDSLIRLEREATSSNDAFERYLRGLPFLGESDNLSDLEVAIHYFERALEADPAFTLARAALARALLLHAERSRDVERLQRGLREARAALDEDPELAIARLALARGLRQAGRPEEAAELLLGLEEEPPGEGQLDPGSQLALLLEQASNARASSRAEEATRLARQATALSPDSWQAWHALGIDSMAKGEWDDARQQLERASSLAPMQAKPVSNRVALELIQDNPQNAADIVDAFRGPITDASLASNAGTAHYMLGSLELAEDYFRLAKQLRPTHEVVRGNLGDVLLKLGRESEARLEYEGALALVEDRAEVFPNAPGVEVAEVFYLAKAERCEEATKADLSRRLKVAEGRELMRLAMGAALCDRHQEALGYLEQALAAGGVSREELRTADEFGALREMPEFTRLLEAI